MEQTLEDPVSVQQFRKEPGPWDPIRLSGDTGDAPVNRQSSDADNQTLRHPHTLQYDIRSPRYGGTRFKFVRSVWQVDQSLSPQSGYGISTSNSRGQHETQTSTSTVPKTTEASFPCLFCHPSKTLDRESRWSPKPSAGHALTPKHSLESETWSQDPLNPTVRSFSSNMPWLVYSCVASLMHLYFQEQKSNPIDSYHTAFQPRYQGSRRRLQLHPRLRPPRHTMPRR